MSFYEIVGLYVDININFTFQSGSILIAGKADASLRAATFTFQSGSILMLSLKNDFKL